MGTVYAIANQKGGVGKTTTAVNLAACVAEAGYETLLVDIDPQCNATVGLGVAQGPAPGRVRVLVGDGDARGRRSCHRDRAPAARCPRARTSPAPPSSSRACAGSETRLRDALAPSAIATRSSLLDCPPSLGPLTVNALVAADRVIVPVQTEYFALEGLAGLLDTLSLVQRELNPRLTVAGMLLTMHDGRTRLAQDVEREVREHFPELVFDTVIPRNVRIGEAPSFGKPVIHHDPHCAGRGRVLRARKGGGRSWLSDRSGMGRGLAAILAVTPREDAEELRHVPLELIDPNPHQPRRAFDEESLLGARRIDQGPRACCSRCWCGRSRAGATSWSPASAAGARPGLAGLETIPAIVRHARRLGVARDGADREHGPRGPQPDRGGARVRRAGRGARAHARGRGAPGRPQPGCRLEPDPPARPARRGAHLIERGDLSEGHGRALLLAEDNADRRSLARAAAAGGWSVRELESTGATCRRAGAAAEASQLAPGPPPRPAGRGRADRRQLQRRARARGRGDAGQGRRLPGAAQLRIG